jgi:hypothetical protein
VANSKLGQRWSRQYRRERKPEKAVTRTIDAGNPTLLRQAPMTANEYLMSAIDHIDQKLGKGYAKQHPELIAAFMQSSAMDLGTAVIARAIESVASAINAMAEDVRFDHVAESLDGIANAIKDAKEGAA